jgi:Protein of unknown function (DUF4435)
MLEHTSARIRNAHLFSKNRYLVVVEGKDDLPFWNLFFPDCINGYRLKIKPVGGTEINKYLEEVVQGNGKFAVALDSDYSLFSDFTHNHPQIVETFVHSIENAMLLPRVLAEIICTKSRHDLEEYQISNIEEWFDHFDEVMYELMVADYLLQSESSSVKFLDNDCVRFLKNHKTKDPIFDPDKISEYISKFNIPDINFKSTRVKLNPHKPSKQIRGHFLFAAALCFVNFEVNRLKGGSKKIHMSNDDLYTILIQTCKSSLSDLPELILLKNKATITGEKIVELLSQ